MKPAQEPAIELRNVNFSYDGKLVLSDLSLQVQPGEFLAVIGPSGCGKSTLLRLLSGLALPVSGTVLAFGKPVLGPGLERAVVFQDYSLFPWMTCGENLLLALEQSDPALPRAQRKAVAEHYLELVGLERNYRSLPGELSGGMRQRIAIARALAIHSPILLMDEPFGALDAITRAHQQELLLNIWQTGFCNTLPHTEKTIVLVTHDVDEALLLADRVIVLGLNPGHLLAEIPVTLARPRSRGETLRHDDFTNLRNQLLAKLDEAVNQELQSATTVTDGGFI